MCVWNRKWKSNKLFYRCQWLFRSPLRFFTSFYWSYRISRDLCDWIKYTLLQRKRRRRADVLWIRFCGVYIYECEKMKPANGSRFCVCFFSLENAQIFQVAFKTEIFSYFLSLAFCSYFLRWNPIFFSSIIIKTGDFENISSYFLFIFFFQQLFPLLLLFLLCLMPLKCESTA